MELDVSNHAPNSAVHDDMSSPYYIESKLNLIKSTFIENVCTDLAQQENGGIKKVLASFSPLSNRNKTRSS